MRSPEGGAIARGKTLGLAATLTLPSPSMERVRTGSPRVGCTRALVVWDVGCAEDPQPSPFQEEILCATRGLVARKTPHRIRPKTAESASPLGEGEERRPLLSN